MNLILFSLFYVMVDEISVIYVTTHWATSPGTKFAHANEINHDILRANTLF